MRKPNLIPCLTLSTTLLVTPGAWAGNPGHGTPSEPPSTKATTPAAPVNAGSKAAKSNEAPASKAAPADTKNAPSPEEAMKWLTEGNTRFTSGQPQNPNCGSDRISEVASGQHPFATILTCADSRIPVERVFDRGVGDLFVVRVAGNVAGTDETGTIEYGCGHLNTPLLVVMGHTGCGAVAAAASGAETHGAVSKLLKRIQPSVDQTRAQYPELKPDQLAPIVVRANVWKSIEDMLTSSEELRGLVNSNKLEVVGAIYDLNTGTVRFLGEHPGQSALLSKTSTEKNPTETPSSQAEAKPVASKTKQSEKPGKPESGTPDPKAAEPAHAEADDNSEKSPH